jgi:GTP-binding protein Era
MTIEISKCGYVAIIGRPNVGKSTFLNAMIGQKISIISPKPQTTRNQILGIKTADNCQTIYIDTPGIHHDEKRTMNRYLNRLASAVIVDADLVIFMVEALRWTEEDEKVLQRIITTDKPTVLAINKVDKYKDKNLLLPWIEKISAQFKFTDVVPFSAQKGDNLPAIDKVIMQHMPAGPHLFPDDQVTDKDIRFQVGEIIREKLIRSTEQELPYSTKVLIEAIENVKKIVDINAVIWVEREGQKAIVIGKNGALLKKIGTSARLEIEKLLGKKVFLRLWVKVKSDWTEDENSWTGYHGESE